MSSGLESRIGGVMEVLQSSLHKFRMLGLESVIFGLVAPYAGLAVVLPCHCCYSSEEDRPMAFCWKQCKTFLLADPFNYIGGTKNSDAKDEFLCPIPLEAFQGGKILFQAELVRFRVKIVSGIPWDRKSRQRQTKIFRNPLVVPQRPATPECTTICRNGLGYVVCTERGILAPEIMEILWSEVDWNATHVRKLKGEGQNGLCLHLEKTGIPTPCTFEYDTYDNEQSKIDHIAAQERVRDEMNEGSPVLGASSAVLRMLHRLTESRVNDVKYGPWKNTHRCKEQMTREYRESITLRCTFPKGPGEMLRLLRVLATIKEQQLMK